MTVSLTLQVHANNNYVELEKKALRWLIADSKLEGWDSYVCDCLTEAGTRFLVSGFSGMDWFYFVVSTADNGSSFQYEYSNGGDAFSAQYYCVDSFYPMNAQHWKEYFAGTRELSLDVALEAM